MWIHEPVWPLFRGCEMLDLEYVLRGYIHAPHLRRGGHDERRLAKVRFRWLGGRRLAMGETLECRFAEFNTRSALIGVTSMSRSTGLIATQRIWIWFSDLADLGVERTTRPKRLQ